MNVELTTDISAEDLTIISELYLNSFPAEERRPWEAIASPAAGKRPELFAVIADGRLAGMLTLWTFDRFASVGHLAIDPSLRGRGVGSAAMRKLIEKTGRKPIVLEIEPPVPERPETVRRRDFYRALGFETIDTGYIQPPYTPDLPSVHLHLMATTILPAGSTARTLHSEVYGKKD